MNTDKTKNVIPGFTTMTKQQLFDLSVSHVLANGRASMNAKGYCIYSGIGCGAAPFMTPEFRTEADKAFGGQGAKWVHFACNREPETLVPDHEYGFIGELQIAHDRAADATTAAAFIDLYLENVRDIADRFNLSTEKLP